MNHQCTEEKFMRDVAQHEMRILRDDKHGRHVRFTRPESSSMRFDLITWPGHLCYTGDMGTFVFSRIEDMFKFFRADREYHISRGSSLAINPGYWGEKLLATSRFGGYEEFDSDKFKRVINEYRVSWMRRARDSGIIKSVRRELWESVEHSVMYSIDDGEHEACRAAIEFSETFGRMTFQFDDLFDRNFKRHTFHYIWCCYALAWGITKYDAEKQIEGVPA